jgi:class 3 adenylate cyclase
VDPPEVAYARSGEVMIAYQVTGEENPVDLVYAPGIVSHLDLDWGWPEVAHFTRQLATFARVIRFDKRGTGLSDRGVQAATLEERADDIRAVMDAVGSERAFLFGESEGGNMSCMFAATYPERTLGLIMWGTMPCLIAGEETPWGVDPAALERLADDVASNGITRAFITGRIGGMAGATDAEIADAIAYYRAAANPSQMAALLRMFVDLDARPILGTISAPTLVMNRVGDTVTPLTAARALAAAIPGAELLTFEGTSHGEYDPPQQDEIVAAIHGFVTGSPRSVAPDRVLATVMFTDIVGSTARAAELGDARWRKILRLHDERARSEILRHRGTYVHTTGDGLLASFDGPARAVRCALAIGERVSDLDIQIRAGCHTGEVERAGDQVQGLAVHIGARVAALAGDGEVWTSSTVKDLTAGSGLTFEDAGEHELKGVPDRWHLYRVVT